LRAGVVTVEVGTLYASFSRDIADGVVTHRQRGLSGLAVVGEAVQAVVAEQLGQEIRGQLYLRLTPEFR